MRLYDDDLKECEIIVCQTLAEGMKRHKDGKIVCKMRLVRGDDPEWLRLKPTGMDSGLGAKAQR